MTQIMHQTIAVFFSKLVSQLLSVVYFRRLSRHSELLTVQQKQKNYLCNFSIFAGDYKSVSLTYEVV